MPWWALSACRSCGKSLKRKMADLNANDVEAACRMLAGTARSMGVQVME